MDIEGVVECFNPKTQAVYKGAMGIGNIAMNAIGLGGSDLKELVGILPFLGSLLGEDLEFPQMECEITDIEYSGGAYESFPIPISSVEKALSSDALVTVEVYLDGEYRGVETLHFKKYGLKGWLMEEDILNFF